jgi:hypothetical protein
VEVSAQPLVDFELRVPCGRVAEPLNGFELTGGAPLRVFKGAGLLVLDFPFPAGW